MKLYLKGKNIFKKMQLESLYSRINFKNASQIEKLRQFERRIFSSEYKINFPKDPV
jgi:hypothetical protein